MFLEFAGSSLSDEQILREKDHQVHYGWLKRGEGGEYVPGIFQSAQLPLTLVN